MRGGSLGYGIPGGTQSGSTTVNGYTVPQDLTLSGNRTGAQPAEYVAANNVEFAGEFESASSDEFSAYIVDASYAGTGNQTNGGSGAKLATGYRYGFNGKENDADVKGDGNQIDYGLRIYDPRLGKFLSIDPLTGKFPFYSPYQYAGNSPIKFIDLDGAETYDAEAKFWSGQPLIDMTKAPNATSYNAAGFPRNAIWFFNQQLAAKPDMFSEANKLLIKSGTNPIVDETWIKSNPSAAPYEGQTLWHHHIDGEGIAAAIPKGLNNDYFSELHPYISGGKSPKGTKVSGLLGGTLNVLGNASMFTGLFTGDPDSWINAFGYGDPHVGDIKKDWGETNLYVQIMSVVDHYTQVTDKTGKVVIDPKTGSPKYRIDSKTVTANIYAGYIWNADTKKFEGVDKIETRTEKWDYDNDGKRKSVQNLQMD